MENGYQSVGKVLKNKYQIPDYQRGYRWTEENVKKLLDDVYEKRLVQENILNNYEDFSFDSRKLVDSWSETGETRYIPKKPYCIQPLVVMKNKDNKEVYDVIDGQQRLTTIIIIRAALNNTLNNLCDGSLKLYNKTELSYESRTNSGEFLSQLCLGNLENDESNNIDFEYMKQTYNEAEKFYKNEIEKVTNDEIKKCYADYLDDILCKNTRFIWYEVSGENPQTIFADFNTGKIELTNAELIKALFMNPEYYNVSTVKDKQIVMSEKWDEIETVLHDPDFWAFVPHKNQYQNTDGDYSTHIDIIFDYYIMNNWLEKNSDENFNDYIEYKRNKISNRYIFDEMSKIFSDELKNIEDIDEKEEKIIELWQSVRKIFIGLRELYQSNGCGINPRFGDKLYNIAGLFIDLCNRDDNFVDQQNKDDFLYLKVYYVLNEALKRPRDKRKVYLVNEIKKRFFGNKDIKSIVTSVKYDSEKPSSVVKLLLTYNIALLCNSNGTGERYNFLANASCKWQREHISACNVKTDDIEEEKEEEYKYALKILAKDFYIKYIIYILNINIEEKINFKNENVNFELDLNKLLSSEEYIYDDVVNKFIISNLAYDGNGKNELLARALKTKQEANKLLEIYILLDKVNNIKSYKENPELCIKMIEEYIKDIGISYFYKENLDISKYKNEIKNELKINSKNEMEIKINNLNYIYTNQNNNIPLDIQEREIWLESKLEDNYEKTNFDDIIEKMQSNYQNTIKNKILDGIKIDDFDIMFASIELSEENLKKKIDDFFEAEFPRLLKDNFMGNMTLLTGNTQKENAQGTIGEFSSGQNQSVSNKSYGEKKEMIFKEYKQGKFIPLGTLLVFADVYTKGTNSAKLWLPDSRLKYIKDIVKTLEIFFEEGEKIDE